MKQYKVFIHPSGSREAVKQGWSWPAACFSGIWPFVKKLWIIGILTLIFSFLFGLFSFSFLVSSDNIEGYHIIEAVSFICNLIFFIIFGVSGNSWRERNLLSRGFEHVSTINATTPDSAIASFLTSGNNHGRTNTPVVATDEISIENENKKCPLCAEQIKFEAIKCRFCGHDFDSALVAEEVKKKKEALEKIILDELQEEQNAFEAIELKLKNAFDEAVQKYNEGEYSVASNIFKEIIDTAPSVDTQIVEQCRFYITKIDNHYSVFEEIQPIVKEAQKPSVGKETPLSMNLPRKPWIAAILTLLTVGLGHIYSGKGRRGIILFILAQIFYVICGISLISFPPKGLVFALFLFSFYVIYFIIDSVKYARESNLQYSLKKYNKLAIYVLCWFVGSVIVGFTVQVAVRLIFVQAFTIRGGGMLNALEDGDHLFVNKLIYGVKNPFTGSILIPFKNPQHGDTIVFRFPQDRSVDKVSRVIGVSGDKLFIKNKKLFINDQAVNEIYAQYTSNSIMPATTGPRDNFGPIKVPEGKIFVMGDSRDNSYDSRFWGFVDQRDVLGKPYCIYWSWDPNTPLFSLNRFTTIRWSRVGNIIEHENASPDKAYVDKEQSIVMDGVVKEKERAAELLAKKATQDVANEQYYQGLMYENGNQVTADKMKAVELYTKAAEKGHKDAQFNLGAMYAKGEGVPQDKQKAAEWYNKAAEQGVVRAQFNLAEMYNNGDGITKDSAKAVQWYTEVAEQGYVNAQYMLGLIYSMGEGVSRDVVRAVEWYTKAANQGDARAQRRLGYIYINGEGVPQDLHKAFELYKKAADQGDVVAQYNLGVMYYNGESVSKDSLKAFELYKKAADQGHAAAQYNLGVMYFSGESVSKNSLKAFELYKKAADQGHAAAQYNLGLMYYLGESISQDSVKAVEWFTRAASQGNLQSKLTLRNINESKNRRN